jgi:8-oxo-dGTP diphosphatase
MVHRSGRGARPSGPPRAGEGARPAIDAEDERFLASYDVTRFERPSVAVDIALLTVADGALHTLLLRRSEPPQRGRWALPGTFVRMDEPLEHAAARALADKAGLVDVFLEQLYTFGTPGRDPRTRVISIAHCALIDSARLERASDACALARLRVPWEGEVGGPVEALGDGDKPLALAFDHALILGMAVKRLRGKLDSTPVGFQLLPERFTLNALQRVHEAVLGRPLNKDSFRRRMLASGQLEATGEHEEDTRHRPAEFYRFCRRSAV